MRHFINNTTLIKNIKYSRMKYTYIDRKIKILRRITCNDAPLICNKLRSSKFSYKWKVTFCYFVTYSYGKFFGTEFILRISTMFTFQLKSLYWIYSLEFFKKFNRNIVWIFHFHEYSKLFWTWLLNWKMITFS